MRNREEFVVEFSPGPVRGGGSQHAKPDQKRAQAQGYSISKQIPHNSFSSSPCWSLSFQGPSFLTVPDLSVPRRPSCTPALRACELLPRTLHSDCSRLEYVTTAFGYLVLQMGICKLRELKGLAQDPTAGLRLETKAISPQALFFPLDLLQENW